MCLLNVRPVKKNTKRSSNTPLLIVSFFTERTLFSYKTSTKHIIIPLSFIEFPEYEMTYIYNYKLQ